MNCNFKLVVWALLALFVLGGAATVSAAELDTEFTQIYVTNTNTEHKLVLTEKDFIVAPNGVMTIRFFFNNIHGIRLHEVRAFEDEEGLGENVLLYAPVVGGPVHHQYKITMVVNDVGFPPDMLESPDKAGFGWGDKWYSGDGTRGVLYISLSAPADIKRIELEMGYTNKGLISDTMAGIDIRVSDKAFTEDELTAKMDAVLAILDYIPTIK